ncbi:MAG: serine/threonine protein kinase [Gemmatimonadaceae bacterium]|nr:serine/threonine protein kinase [Gemmatimonadaceae bacterium]
MPDRYLGRIIGKYRVIRLLGTGAFSWVYEAVDQDLEIPVALKILRPEFAGREEAEARFRREAATAARLRHRHIVSVRDVGAVDGAAFVAMDLYPITLGRRLSLVGHLPETECVSLGIGVAAALSQAHAAQIVHRDIKPDNILLDNEGQAVVADFGLARALTAITGEHATAEVQGTPHYFSPEQARGGDVDGRSDLYALGVTLFRAATGRLPFDGEDWYAISRQHIETPAPSAREFNDEISPEFDAVLQRLLAKLPEQRYATALQLVDALASLPTAPAQAGASTLRSTSHTIEAWHTPAPVAKPSRRWVIPTFGAAAILTLLTLSLWLRIPAGLFPQTPGPSAPGTSTDTSAAGRLPLPSDSAPRVSVPGGPIVSDTTQASGATKPAPARPRPAATPRTFSLSLLTHDSAQLFVDNRQVGVGSWTGERPPGARLTVRAVLPNAPATCQWAERDSVLGPVKAGQELQIELPVRNCVTVKFDVEPRDARVAIAPLDGGIALETRADSAGMLLLPTGRYEVKTSAQRCFPVTDTLIARPQADGTPVSRRFRLLCN